MLILLEKSEPCSCGGSRVCDSFLLSCSAPFVHSEGHEVCSILKVIDTGSTVVHWIYSLYKRKFCIKNAQKTTVDILANLFRFLQKVPLWRNISRDTAKSLTSARCRLKRVWFIKLTLLSRRLCSLHPRVGPFGRRMFGSGGDVRLIMMVENRGKFCKTLTLPKYSQVVVIIINSTQEIKKATYKENW